MKFLVLLLLLPIISFGQETKLPSDTTNNTLFDYVEVEPEFNGGTEAMTEFIVNQVVYPKKAKRKGQQGIVYVKFIVNKDGSLSNIGVRKGVSKLLDNEALRVISIMPNWIPGEQNGKPVRVNYTLPIHFRLD